MAGIGSTLVLKRLGDDSLGGTLYIKAAGIDMYNYALAAAAGSTIDITNQAVKLTNAYSGITLIDSFNTSTVPYTPAGSNVSINTGALVIDDVFHGIHTEIVSGSDTPNNVNIEAKTVDITALETVDSGNDDGKNSAAIFAINESVTQPDTISITGSKYVNLLGGRLGVALQGMNELTINSPLIKIGSYGETLAMQGATNNVELTGDEVYIYSEGSSGDSHGIGASTGTEYNTKSNIDITSKMIINIKGGADGVYLENAKLTAGGYGTERTGRIVINGGRYGISAFRTGDAKLYADSIIVSGGSAGLGIGEGGGNITLSAPIVSVEATETDGKSIFSTYGGTITVGDKDALVQLTGKVQSGSKDDDGTIKSPGGTAVLNLDAEGSFLKGQSYDLDWDSDELDEKGITMNLGYGAYWSFSGESTMRFLNGGGGKVQMQNGTVGDTANIGTLSGKGSFLLDTDIDADKADSVFAKTGSGAEYGVLVQNSGSDPNRERMNQIPS